MQKIKADQEREWKHMALCLLQNTRNIHHMYKISDSRCNLTYSTVPAGVLLISRKTLGLTSIKEITRFTCYPIAQSLSLELLRNFIAKNACAMSARRIHINRWPTQVLKKFKE